MVFREGFEIVLSYEAILADAPAIPVLGGLVVGAVLAMTSAYLILGLKTRLPVTAFFRVTGGLLALMSITLVGSGIRGLQTAALMPATTVPWFRDHAWLQLYLGLYPVSEALLSQAIVAGATTISPMALATSCKASVSAGVTFGLGGSHAACENDDPVTHILTRLLKMPPMALLANNRIAEGVDCSATRRMLTSAVIVEVSDPVNAVQKECHKIPGWQVARLVDGQDCLMMLIVTS